MLGPGDEGVLERVAPDVFDDPIDVGATKEFLADERHHIAVAIDEGRVVGFVSAVHYVHPDKPRPEMWINEVSVAASHRRRGLARELIDAVVGRARELGCTEAWVLTDETNEAAKALYTTTGAARDGGAVMFTYCLKPRG